MQILKFKNGSQFYVEKGTFLFEIDLFKMQEKAMNFRTNKASKILRDKKNYPEITKKELLKQLRKTQYLLSENLANTLKIKQIKVINYINT